MNVFDALELLKSGRVVKPSEWVGSFSLSGNWVNISCPGDYPCCHDSITIDDFLENYKDDTFTEV